MLRVMASIIISFVLSASICNGQSAYSWSEFAERMKKKGIEISDQVKAASQLLEEGDASGFEKLASGAANEALNKVHQYKEIIENGGFQVDQVRIAILETRILMHIHRDRSFSAAEQQKILNAHNKNDPIFFILKGLYKIYEWKPDKFEIEEVRVGLKFGPPYFAKPNMMIVFKDKDSK